MSAGEGKLFGVAISAMIVMYLASTLATTLNDANTTSLKENIASGLITGFSVYVLAVILLVIGLSYPYLRKVFDGFGQ